MKSPRAPWLSALVAFALLAAWSVDVRAASATLEGAPPPTTEIGRPFDLAVRIDLPAGAELVSIQALGNPHVDVQIDRARSADRVWPRTESVRVAAYRPGRHDVEALEVVYLAPDGSQARVRTAPFAIEVAGTWNPAEGPTLAEVPGFVTIGSTPVWLQAILASVAGLALVWLLRRLARPAPAEAPPEPDAPIIPPHEIALQALRSLEASDLLEQGRFVDFHLRLSEILKAWVGATFDFGASEMTTSEIRAAMATREHDVGEWRFDIERILRETDFVKFARGATTPEESMERLRDTRELVEQASARAIALASAGAAVSARAAVDDDVPPPISADDDALTPAPPQSLDAEDVPPPVTAPPGGRATQTGTGHDGGLP